MTGPEVGAADADVDDGADALAGVARPLPGADRVGELRPCWPSTACTSVTHVLAVDGERASPGSRSAVCSTARSSLVLMCTPANIASMRSGSPARRASAVSSGNVSRVIRCLE